MGGGALKKLFCGFPKPPRIYYLRKYLEPGYFIIWFHGKSCAQMEQCKIPISLSMLDSSRCKQMPWRDKNGPICRALYLLRQFISFNFWGDGHWALSRKYLGIGNAPFLSPLWLRPCSSGYNIQSILDKY